MAENGVAYTTINTNTSERFQSLRRELGVEGFGINAITLAPRQRGRIHDHEHQEEVFLVLDGELTLAIEGEPIAAKPGTLVAVAPGTVHTFSNRSEQPARFLGIVSPGGFEQYFRDLAAAIGDGPFDPAVVAPLIARYDYEVA